MLQYQIPKNRQGEVNSLENTLQVHGATNKQGPKATPSPKVKSLSLRILQSAGMAPAHLQYKKSKSELHKGINKLVISAQETGSLHQVSKKLVQSSREIVVNKKNSKIL